MRGEEGGKGGRARSLGPGAHAAHTAGWLAHAGCLPARDAESRGGATVAVFFAALLPFARSLSLSANHSPLHHHHHHSLSTLQGAVWSCILDAPALRAATASADFSARLWDAISGDELAHFPHSHIVRTAAFSPSGDALVTGGYEKVVRVWDLGGPGPGSSASAEPRDAFTAPDKVRHAAYTADGGSGLLLTTYMDSPGVGCVGVFCFVCSSFFGPFLPPFLTGCVLNRPLHSALTITT
jgi:hypothetical protein